MRKKNNNSDFKLRYFLYTFIGYTLFTTIFIIQFFIFTPISVILHFIGIDNNKLFFTYATKLSCRSFFLAFIGHKININLKEIKAPKKGEKRLYLLNHSSIYDVIMSYLLAGPSKFIIKDKWVKKPFIGWMQGLAGNIVVGEEKDSNEANDTSLNAIQKTLDAFNRGISIIVFPEGTRSDNGMIQRFKRGSFKIALDAECDLVPVVMDDWNTIRPTGLMIRDIKPVVKLIQPIKYSQYSHLTHIELAKLIRYIMAKELYAIREERKQKEKNYYRNDEKYAQEDLQAKEELEKIKADLDAKNISLKALN